MVKAHVNNQFPKFPNDLNREEVSRLLPTDESQSCTHGGLLRKLEKSAKLEYHKLLCYSPLEVCNSRLFRQNLHVELSHFVCQLGQQVSLLNKVFVLQLKLDPVTPQVSA